MSKKRGRKKYKSSPGRRQRVRRTLTRMVLDDYRRARNPFAKVYEPKKRFSKAFKRLNIVNLNGPTKTNKQTKSIYKQTNKQILDKIKICKDRKDRRKALFRLSRAGKGIAGPKNKWMTIKSYTRC